MWTLSRSLVSCLEMINHDELKHTHIYTHREKEHVFLLHEESEMGDIRAISRGAPLQLEMTYQPTSIPVLLDRHQAVAKTNLCRRDCSTKVKRKESDAAQGKMQRRSGGGGHPFGSPQDFSKQR